MFKIFKSFPFCYGHRVWTQDLDKQFSVSSICKCRHLHGHQGKITISLSGEDVNDQGMVTDFHHLNWFKKILNDFFDHKMILDAGDPLIKILTGHDSPYNMPTNGECLDWIEYSDPISGYYLSQHVIGHLIKDKPPEESRAMAEFLEGIILVPFVPTSENFARYFFYMVQTHMQSLLDKEMIVVDSVTFEETPTSRSEFSRPIHRVF